MAGGEDIQGQSHDAQYLRGSPQYDRRTVTSSHGGVLDKVREAVEEAGYALAS
ncbi:MAG: hypothetical protein L0H64_18395 [Pseudonocardia sp.]|nr:hypothetical protein [Pseudonocardia sp.]